MVTMTDESPRYETREVSHDDSIQRSGQFGIIADTVQALGPSGIAAAGAYVAGKVVDAVKEVTVARIQSGNDQQGGRHREQ